MRFFFFFLEHNLNKKNRKPKKTIPIGCCYLPKPTTVLIEKLCANVSHFQSHLGKRDYIVLCGDFNLPGVTWKPRTQLNPHDFIPVCTNSEINLIFKEFILETQPNKGSILGPLLFTLFVNDIPLCMSSARCLMYADDLKLYLPVTKLIDCEKLQADITSLREWWKLCLNVSKCNVISFSTKLKN